MEKSPPKLGRKYKIRLSEHGRRYSATYTLVIVALVCEQPMFVVKHGRGARYYNLETIFDYQPH